MYVLIHCRLSTKNTQNTDYLSFLTGLEINSTTFVISNIFPIRLSKKTLAICPTQNGYDVINAKFSHCSAGNSNCQSNSPNVHPLIQYSKDSLFELIVYIC